MIGDYFEMITITGESRGKFRVIGEHLTGMSITYRNARWHERLWLWVTRQNVEMWLLDYSKNSRKF